MSTSPSPHAAATAADGLPPLPVWLSGLAELTELARQTVERTVRDLGPAQRHSPEYASAAQQVRRAAQAIIADLRRVEHVLCGYVSPAGPLGEGSPIGEALAALRPLAAIADRYDDDGLDEARPEWGDNSRDPESIELLSGRGGKQLLTLADAFRARTALARAGGAA